MYQGNPSIADRMRVLDFKASLLRKNADDGGATAAMPAPVSPPMGGQPMPPMPEPMGAPSPDEMNAAATGQVYADNQEALADVHGRLIEIAVDLTNHVGTVDMQATMDNLQMDMPDAFSEHIIALRDRVESLAKIVKVIRMQNPEMVGHGQMGEEMPPEMGGGMPPEMGGGMPPEMGGLQNMPAAGPAGMPPGGMPPGGMPMGGM